MCTPVIKILSINIQGLTSKLPILQDLLSRYQPDIACVQETKTSEHHRLNLPNYKHYLSPSERGHAQGISTYVKKPLKHSHIKTTAKDKTESQTIQIVTQHGKINVSNFYQSPSTNLNTSHIRRITRLAGQHLIIGDFNSPSSILGSNRDSQSGKLLYNLLNRSNLICHLPDKPTRGHNFLDLALGLGITANVDITTLPATASDHRPILCELRVGASTIPPNTTNSQKTNWFKAARLIARSTGWDELTTRKDIDAAVDNVQRSITDATAATTPKPRHCPTKLDPLPIETHILRRRMQQLSRTQNRSAAHKRAFKTARTEFHKALSSFRNQQWEKTLAEDASTPGHIRLWKRIKSMKQQQQDIPDLKTPSGLTASTSLAKAEALAERYDTVHSMTDNLGHPRDVIIADEELTAYMSSTAPIPLKKVTPQEIKLLISKTKNRKAPGRDGISNLALKHLPPPAIERLTDIFNACLRISYFPAVWKQAHIRPIPKPGKDLSLPASHRPISLLSGLGKILEKCISHRITQHLDANDLFNPNQFGFRRGHSTVHALAKLSDRIAVNINLNKCTGATLLDASEAFPTMNHRLLLQKMTKLKFPPNLITLVKNYLSKRPFRVLVEDQMSIPRTMANGTPQGSVLGPLLFLIYVNDIKDTVKDLIIYADDTTPISESINPRKLVDYMQIQLTKTVDYMDKNKILVNAAKTQAIIFTRKRKKGRHSSRKAARNRYSNLKIDNAQIEWSSSVKLLGVYLDKSLRFTTHLQKTLQKAAAACKHLQRFWRAKALSTNIKVRLYTMYVRPILTYASPAWTSKLSASNIKRLQAVQTKCLRTALGKPASITKMNESAGIPALPDFIQQQNDNFFRKLRTLPAHLSAIGNLQAKQIYQGKRQRVRLANAPIQTNNASR